MMNKRGSKAFNGSAVSGKAMLSTLVTLVWLSSVASAMGVVYSTYESRKATQKLEELRREANGLRVMSGKYLLEKSSWSAYSRVEEIAVNDLKMVVPDNESTVLVFKK